MGFMFGQSMVCYQKRVFRITKKNDFLWRREEYQRDKYGRWTPIKTDGRRRCHTKNFIKISVSDPDTNGTRRTNDSESFLSKMHTILARIQRSMNNGNMNGLDYEGRWWISANWKSIFTPALCIKAGNVDRLPAHHEFREMKIAVSCLLLHSSKHCHFICPNSHFEKNGQVLSAFRLWNSGCEFAYE